MKVVAVALGVCLVDGKLPLIKFKRNIYAGWWGLPGGKMEDTEFAPETVEREFLEEVKHPVRCSKIWGVVDELSRDTNESWRLVLHVCSVEPVGPVDMKTIDIAEGTIHWFSLAELADRRSEIVPSDYRIIQDIVLGNQPGYYRCKLNNTVKPPQLELFERA